MEEIHELKNWDDIQEAIGNDSWDPVLNIKIEIKNVEKQIKLRTYNKKIYFAIMNYFSDIYNQLELVEHDLLNISKKQMGITNTNDIYKEYELYRGKDYLK